jgi:hypothetical protein
MKMHKYKKVANKNQNACLMMKQNVKLLENMSSTFERAFVPMCGFGN